MLTDSLGELQRGIENVEYASYARAAQGEHSRNVGPGIDSWSEFQALGVTAGITPSTFRRWCRCGCGPWPWRAATPSCSSPPSAIPAALFIAELAPANGAATRRAERGQRRQGRPWTPVDRPARESCELCGLHPNCRIHLQHRMQTWQAGTGFGRQKPCCGHARCRHWQRRHRALMGAAYGSCGERCMAIPLVVAVGDDTADKVVAALKVEIAKMKVGPGTDATCDMGPLVLKPHYEKVKGYVDQGVKEGAQLVVDGRGLTVPGHENGYYLGPRLFDHVKPGMVIYQEEIFGPVLGVVRVQSLQEAMSLIDAHEYGNGTCIFTRDGMKPPAISPTTFRWAWWA